MQSFSEIDTTSKRASKAAGFSWGIAEEIAEIRETLQPEVVDDGRLISTIYHDPLFFAFLRITIKI